MSGRKSDVGGVTRWMIGCLSVATTASKYGVSSYRLFGYRLVKM